MGKIKDLSGQRFGRLVAIDIAGRDKSRQIIWNCDCDCGNSSQVLGACLRNGGSKSCGCLQKELLIARSLTHGHSSSGTYAAYTAMRQRCYDTSADNYKYYGGRGITVCNRWLESFENFYEDMGERPKGMTLDRYPNNNGIYEPSNCRWASMKQQRLNQRQRFSDNDIKLIRQTKAKSKDLALILGVSYSAITAIRRGDTYKCIG